MAVRAQKPSPSPKGSSEAPSRRRKPARPAGRGGLPGRKPAPPRRALPPAQAFEALLALSRGLAEARTEDEIAAALARVLGVLFPGRCFAIRLVDPKTLALTTLYARGALRPRPRGRLQLRRRAVVRTGLAAEPLLAAGVVLADRDEPLFEGCDRATAVPLVASGQLLGVINLEYRPGTPGDPHADGALLKQLANHGAVGVRNLHSVEELTYLKTYLEGLVEHANALILAVDHDRRVTVWNGALVTLTGAARAAAVGAPLGDRVVPEDRGRLDAALAASSAGEPVDGVQVRFLCGEAGQAPVTLNTAPIHGVNGVEGVIAIGQDLTALRSAQEVAEHAERLAGIGRLVAGVVHELNNPLTAVNMYAESLLEKLGARGQDPADLEKLRSILEGGQRIQRLARDLVTYARPGGGGTSPVELGPVLDEGLRMAKPALREAGAVLVREPGTATVRANRSSLVQVVLALVSNAAQAVKPGGKVRVGLKAGPGQVSLVVADDGSGMAADVAARAFEPFFTTRPGAGIGLGLPIVLGIVDRHRGRVSLDTAPGRGTTVTVTLPVDG